MICGENYLFTSEKNVDKYLNRRRRRCSREHGRPWNTSCGLPSQAVQPRLGAHPSQSASATRLYQSSMGALAKLFKHKREGQYITMFSIDHCHNARAWFSNGKRVYLPSPQA